VKYDFQKPIQDLQLQQNGCLLAVVQDRQIDIIDLEGHHPDPLETPLELPIFKVIWSSEKLLQVVLPCLVAIIEIDEDLKDWKLLKMMDYTNKHFPVQNRDDGEYLRSYFYAQEEYRRGINHHLSHISSMSVKSELTVLDRVVAISSQGDIIFWDGNSSTYTVHSVHGYWFNNVKGKRGDLYLASAEGDIVVFDVQEKRMKYKLSCHQDQVLDLAVYQDLVISISVDGTVCF
jgi:WD40 repeat protein